MKWTPYLTLLVYFMGLLKKTEAISDVSASIEEEGDAEIGINFEVSSLIYVTWYFQVTIYFFPYEIR